MSNNYLSVSKFAKQADLSKAAAYSLLEQEEYRQFVVVENGVKKVSTDLLAVLKQKQVESEQAERKVADSPAPPERKDEDKREEQPPTEKEDQQNTAAAEEIEKLRQEIEELRQTVKEREATISEKDKQITEFALKFADLAQQAQIIAGQAQILQAADKPKAIEAQITAAEEVAEPQKKKGFFKRLFGN